MLVVVVVHIKLIRHKYTERTSRVALKATNKNSINKTSYHHHPFVLSNSWASHIIPHCYHCQRGRHGNIRDGPIRGLHAPPVEGRAISCCGGRGFGNESGTQIWRRISMLLAVLSGRLEASILCMYVCVEGSCGCMYVCMYVCPLYKY